MFDAEPTQHDAASANTASSLRRVVRALMVIAGLSLLALIYVPLDVWSYSETKLAGVAVLKPGVDGAIWYFGGACTLVMLVLSTVCWKRRLRWQYTVCLAAGFLAFPLAAAYRVTASVAPWTVYSTCRGPDDQTHVFMESSFLQGQTLALGSVAADGVLYKNFAILGDTNGDSPRSYALIVRPTDKVRTTYGQLQLADSGTMLGIRYDNRCFFAYDFATKQFAGHGDIESISPFLLVDTDSHLYDTDVATLFKDPDAQPVGLPSRRVLLDATNHANDEVRRLAQQLLERGDTE